MAMFPRIPKQRWSLLTVPISWLLMLNYLPKWRWPPWAKKKSFNSELTHCTQLVRSPRSWKSIQELCWNMKNSILSNLSETQRITEGFIQEMISNGLVAWCVWSIRMVILWRLSVQCWPLPRVGSSKVVHLKFERIASYSYIVTIPVGTEEKGSFLIFPVMSVSISTIFIGWRSNSGPNPKKTPRERRLGQERIR